MKILRRNWRRFLFSWLFTIFPCAPALLIEESNRGGFQLAHNGETYDKRWCVEEHWGKINVILRLRLVTYFGIFLLFGIIRPLGGPIGHSVWSHHFSGFPFHRLDFPKLNLCFSVWHSLTLPILHCTTHLYNLFPGLWTWPTKVTIIIGLSHHMECASHCSHYHCQIK